MGECLVRTKSWYGFGKGVHMVKDYPNVRAKARRIVKLNQVVLEAPKMNYFYALKAGVNKKSLQTL